MVDVVEINKLTFRYNDKFIFDRFSLNVKKGEWLCLSGPNGSGKSTLLKLICGVLPSNSIHIFGYNPNSNYYEVRRQIGVMFSDIDNLFVCETVFDELIFMLENLCYSKREIDRLVKKVSEEFNITKLLNKSIDELSGGEKARLSLAVALIHNPSILIIDESLSMIDSCDKKYILSKLSEKHKKGLTIISAIHDLSESFYADRLVVLNDGEIMLDGAPFKVMEYDKVLNRLGIGIPFEVELSLKLKLYGVLDKIIPDIGKMVDTIWK